MKRGILMLLLFAVPVLFLAGCGNNTFNFLADKDSAEALRYEITKALDDGDYDFVINKLENDPAYQQAFADEDRYINLAAAHMGDAGFDITTVINDMIGTGQTDAFQGFVSALSARASGQGLNKLDRSVNNYEKILSGLDCVQDKNILTDLQKDACFYSGIVNTVKATSSLTLLLGGPEEVDEWINPDPAQCDDVDGNNIADVAQATACATSYAVDPTAVTTCTETPLMASLDFSGGKSFTPLQVTVTTTGACSDSTYYKLIDINTTPNSPAVTDGYCMTDYTECTPPDYVNCWPCPVVSDSGETLTVVDAVVEAINNGVDAIVSMLPEGQDTGIVNSIDDFKTEICGSPDCTVTQTDIATYLSQ